LARLEFESKTFCLFYLYPVRLEKRVCLSHDVQVTGEAQWAATRIMEGVGDLVQRTRDGRTGRILGERMIERSGNTMCGPHCARGDEGRGFLS
jgi:hypothetical protein